MGYSPQGHKESDTTERLHSLNTVGGMQTDTATMENSVEIPLKIGNRTAI